MNRDFGQGGYIGQGPSIPCISQNPSDPRLLEAIDPTSEGAGDSGLTDPRHKLQIPGKSPRQLLCYLVQMMFTFQTPLLVTLLTPHHRTAAMFANQCRLYNQLVHVDGCRRDSLRVGGGWPSLLKTTSLDSTTTLSHGSKPCNRLHHACSRRRNTS